MASNNPNQTQNKNVIYITPKTNFGFKHLFMDGLKTNSTIIPQISHSPGHRFI